LAYKVTADTYIQAVTPTKRAAQTKLVKMILRRRNERWKSARPASDLFLSNLFETSAKKPDSNKFFILLASPTGFEPVLPP
jgi:hypothetical protein